MKKYIERKCVRAIFVITSECKNYPTDLWKVSTQRFDRTIFDDEEVSKVFRKTVKIAEIKERRDKNSVWKTRFIFIKHHDIHIIKTICGETQPEEVVLVGRRCFLEKYRSKNDHTESRYHWSGYEYPFGWLMYLDKKGEYLDGSSLQATANEIGSVFMTNFEREMVNGRLRAAKNKA